jgi:transposase
VWFWDETGFSLRVIRRKSWTLRGKRQKVTGIRSRGRINVMGGLRYHDRKNLSFFVEQGNGESFLESLEKLNQFIKAEWMKQGNKLEFYERIGPIVLVILDNASYHKRQDILEKIAQSLPNIQLCFLPAYSPDLNLIELVWHSCKEFIAHRLFESVNQLQEILEKLLNQGKLIISWSRNIQNKGNRAIAS